MGGSRGIETRNSKRSNSTSKKEYVDADSATIQTPITVGALEVQNVKRAINRYGTLPKGARIGAYLESLRQTSDGVQSQAAPINKNNLLVNENPAPVAPINTIATAIKAQPQMIRSNSSGGVTMNNPAVNNLNKLQRHRTTTDGSMITFSSFRGASNSPKRGIRPSLADLEFPPPPLDLPPPPEENDLSNEDNVSMKKNDQMSINASQLTVSSLDVENTEPSVEEASTRFGVSLRKHEPSTEGSCSSIGSPEDGSESQAPKEKIENNVVVELKATDSFKQKSEQNKNLKTDKTDQVTQLVNELAESMNLPDYKTTSAIRRTASANSSVKPPINQSNNDNDSTKSFKSQLKKVNPKRSIPAQKKEESSGIIDFKSRLRKVDSSQENLNDNQVNDNNKNNEEKITVRSNKTNDILDVENEEDRVNQNDQKNGNNVTNNNDSNKLNKTEIKINLQPDDKKRENLDNNPLKNESEDDKRKSTGSISSLKKLWEAKESPQGEQISQLSPKMGFKNVGNKPSDQDECVEEQQINSNKKPAVPVKPIKLTIYATPVPQQVAPINNKTNDLNATLSANSSSSSVVTNTSPLSTTTLSTINRETILDLVNLLESNLKTPVNTISASQWLQLSDKLNTLQNSCVVFADKETVAPHLKFHFRELGTRVENQSRCLRSAGSKNVQENEKLVIEVGQSLKQISNALHR